MPKPDGVFYVNDTHFDGRYNPKTLKTLKKEFQEEVRKAHTVIYTDPNRNTYVLKNTKGTPQKKGPAVKPDDLKDNVKKPNALQKSKSNWKDN